MDMMRAYRFRIYPDAKRQKEIDERLMLAQQLYNKILEKSIEEYKKSKNAGINKTTLNEYMKYAIKENKDFLRLYSQTRQDIFIRLQKAYSNFFRRCKEKKQGKKIKAGFPRFKSADRWRSLTYPQYNGSFSIEKERRIYMLRLSRVGRVRIDLHRGIEGKIKTLTIKREAGKYFAIFTTIQEEAKIPKVENANPVGIDVGLTVFAALSDGTTIKKPKFARQNEKRLHHWERIKARRIKDSKNRRKAIQKIQRVWQDTTNQNIDFIQKETTKLVNSNVYTAFVMEDLEIRNMVKNHKYARSIQEAAWRISRSILAYKAERAGMGFKTVPYQYTTQRCSRCGNVKEGEDKLKPGERIYRCFVCGLVIDRDWNASINIKALGSSSPNFGGYAVKSTEGPSGSNASGDVTSTMQRASQVVSMNQEHTSGYILEGSPYLQVGEEVTNISPYITKCIAESP
ncbi:transposase, IS605 OrfB family [mine drainage metagenome]|uniref:Transposase, IS605 OrfB family n=2 Tax=mine drainage metagenome TaxID=410659 RepID=T0Z7E9_9ZZZZ